MKERTSPMPFSSGNYRGCIRRNALSPELAELLHDPDRAFSDPASSVIKDSNTTSSCITARRRGEVHIKRYNYQSRLYALKSLFRASRAKRVWEVSHKLVARHVPIPPPISFVEQRKGLVLIKSFFITKKIDRALPLSVVAHQLQACALPGKVTQKKNLLCQVAHLVREMHECGVSHRDLKASNILVQDNPGESQKLYLVDLDSVRVRKKVPPQERTRDLARLNASLRSVTAITTADRLRFLHYYLGVNSTRDGRVREHWKSIAEQTTKKGKNNLTRHR